MSAWITRPITAKAEGGLGAVPKGRSNVSVGALNVRVSARPGASRGSRAAHKRALAVKKRDQFGVRGAAPETHAPEPTGKDAALAVTFLGWTRLCRSAGRLIVRAGPIRL